MATIQFTDYNDPTSVIRLDTDDFPDASTQAGKDAIEAAIAELHPNPSYIIVTVETPGTVTIDEETYPYVHTKAYGDLQDWYDTL